MHPALHARAQYPRLPCGMGAPISVAWHEGVGRLVKHHLCARPGREAKVALQVGGQAFAWPIAGVLRTYRDQSGNHKCFFAPKFTVARLLRQTSSTKCSSSCMLCRQLDTHAWVSARLCFCLWALPQSCCSMHVRITPAACMSNGRMLP